MSRFFVCFMIVPAFLLNFITVFGLFHTNLEKNLHIDKSLLGVASQVSLAVILGDVAKFVPITGTMPLLGRSNYRN